MTTSKATAASWLADGRPAIVVEVTEARGSVPRDAGTRMLVGAGLVDGTIGGGHLEWKAIEQARQMLASSETVGPQSVHYPLGPALGQCCGGAVTLDFSLLDGPALARWGERPPLFHLQLYGAGHVGRAIVHALASLNVRIDWIDEREQEFARHVAPVPGAAHVRSICVDAVEAEVRLAPPSAFYLVLTHEHDLDLRITDAILRRGDFGFLGLIGSKTKRERFFHRFEQRGFARSLIDRITCPIGIPGIDGKEPELIALAVAAQMVQVSGRLDKPGPLA